MIITPDDVEAQAPWPPEAEVVDWIVADALKRVDVRLIYVEAPSASAHAPTRARADPVLKHGVCVYDGAMKAVASKLVHAEPRVEISAPRQPKRSVPVSEDDIKSKRKSKSLAAIKAAAHEPFSSFDLGPLKAEPPICVQAQPVVEVDALVARPAAAPPPATPELIDEYEYVPGRPVTCPMCDHHGAPLDDQGPYCAKCGLKFFFGDDD
jgi:hypothetical protein